MGEKTRVLKMETIVIGRACEKNRYHRGWGPQSQRPVAAIIKTPVVRRFSPRNRSKNW